MAITTQTVKIDLNTGKTIPVVYAHQNDTNRAIQFEVYNENAPFSLSGYTVKFGYVSPKVNGAYTVIAGDDMASGTVSGNKVTVTLSSAYTAISGVGMLTMVITPTSGTVRPVNIRLVVQKSADGADVIASASDFPSDIEGIVNGWLTSHFQVTLEEVQALVTNDATLTLSVAGKEYVYDNKHSLYVYLNTAATSSMADADNTSY